MTIAPALRDRKHPHSRTLTDRARYWFLADPPLAYLGEMSPPGQIKFWITRAVRFCWRWRDVSPGPIAAVALWLAFRPPAPILILIGALVTVGAVWWDGNHDRTANKDRQAVRLKRRWQKAWLDLNVDTPIPAIEWWSLKPHALILNILLVEGSDDRTLYLKATRRLGNIYRRKASFHPHGDGTATVVITHSDPLATEPDHPTHLGNPAGPELTPRWDRLPIGIGRDAEPFTLNLFENSLLVVGRPRTGKSSTVAALMVSMLAARWIEPWAIDPQVVSLRPFKDHIPFAGNPTAALELVQDFHRSMQKREAEMDEHGTSLATPGPGQPLKVLCVDELLRLIDPDLQTPDYAKRFLAYTRDILSAGPKTGHVLIATATNPRASLLTEGFRDLFTMTLCFRVRDATASGVALGKGNVPDGYKPHELPNDPGRAILMADDWHQLRTYRMWDTTCREAVERLVPYPPPTGPATLLTTGNGQEPPTSDIPTESANLPTSGLRRGEARDVILRCFQSSGIQTIRQVSEKTGISESTVKRWVLGSDGCTDPIPVQRHPRGRYGLIGGQS